MTRARALKQVIRERAARTGERYTTARRHILRELNPSEVAAAKAAAVQANAVQTNAPTKGGLSDAKAIEKTGHDLRYWFNVLDKFDALAKGHTAAAKHLRQDHGVPSWYCQGITVAYERARGKRVMNQSCAGTFNVSVTKTVPIDVKKAAKLFSDSKQRRRWAGNSDAGLVAALTAGVKTKGIATRPDGQARFRYKWDGTTIQFYLRPSSSGKTAIAVDHMNLPGPADVERFRARWKAALTAIAEAAK